MHTILLVSSNYFYHELLEQFCSKRDGYGLMKVESFDECQEQIQQEQADIVITDVLSAHEMASLSALPLIYFSEHSQEPMPEHVAVIKRPCYFDDVLKILRTKLEASRIRKDKRISWSVFMLDVLAKELHYLPSEVRISLTDKEIALIVCLHSLRDKEFVSHDDLAEYVLGHENTVDSHAIPSHIYRLRQKLAEHSIEEDIITTDKKGYRLVIRRS
ncbi:MAG: winged helix-turn-helix domain-containing protein [Rickettsiales bacterium]|nr:winged helix-turn-helix domain-containing protein [Rickettsiales bacterium]